MLEKLNLSAGQLFAERYKIERVLGSGGMGWVYLARDRHLKDLPVALKVLHTNLCTDKRFTERFAAEALSTRKVSHEGVIRIFDINIRNDPPYFTLEYIDGRNVDELYKAHELSYQRLPWLLEEICKALDAIHREHVVHRDIKPKNIIISRDGKVKITDFGIACFDSTDLSKQYEVIGSGPYMAPEIWSGLAPRPQTDLYALGVMFYFLYTSAMPFSGESSSDLMVDHLRGLKQAPIEINKDMPAWMNRLIIDLLKDDLYLRPRSAVEVIERIHESLSLERQAMHQIFDELPPVSAFEQTEDDRRSAVNFTSTQALRQRLNISQIRLRSLLLRIASYLAAAIFVVTIVCAYLGAQK